MTRELNLKSSVSLLKNSFAAKGVVLKHLEALDLLAQLKGFEGWAHSAQAERKTKEKTPVEQASKPVENKLVVTSAVADTTTLLDEFLKQYGGLRGAHPAFTRAAWPSEAGRAYREFRLSLGDINPENRQYWGWVMTQVELDPRHCQLETFSKVFADVTLPGTAPKKAAWQLEASLTDRWGELNEYALGAKPGLALLMLDEVLLESLREMMWDETTFVVRKNGVFGVLYEVEFCSQESEESLADDGSDYKPHVEVKAALLNGLAALALKFPSVEFAYPDESEMVHDRPGAWAFAAMGTLSLSERAELGQAMLSL